MKKRNFLLSYVLSVCAFALSSAGLTSCADEINEQPMMVAEKTTIIPSSAVATVLNISTDVKNGGKIGTLTVTGNGAMEVSSVDATTGEVSTQPYTILSEGAASATLDQDTTWVDELGVVEIVGYPETTTEDISSDEKSGQKTTMATWKFSDGQSATGEILWAFQKAQNRDDLPHLVLEDLRLNKVVSVEVLDERHAKVTLSFLVDVKGENSKTTTGAGEQEIKVSYIQALPEPEKPTPTWALTFNMSGGMLKGTLTVNDGKGGESIYPWTAADCGHYNGMEILRVASTEVLAKRQTIEEGGIKETKPFYRADSTVLWKTVSETQIITDERDFRNMADTTTGPKCRVFFATKSVEAALPDGKVVKVKINQSTSFAEKDNFETVESLKGKVIQQPNETTQYEYNTTHSYSADHYVSCTVVDFDGTEKSFPIDCLTGGLYLHNVAVTNLYTRK